MVTDPEKNSSYIKDMIEKVEPIDNNVINKKDLIERTSSLFLSLTVMYLNVMQF